MTQTILMIFLMGAHANNLHSLQRFFAPKRAAVPQPKVQPQPQLQEISAWAPLLFAGSTLALGGYLLWKHSPLLMKILYPQPQSEPAPVAREDLPKQPQAYQPLLIPAPENLHLVSHVMQSPLPAPEVIISHPTPAFMRPQGIVSQFERHIQRHYTQQPSAQTVLAQYQEGRKLFHTIMNQETVQLSIDEIRSLIWFFYLEAVATKTDYNFFKEGTFKFIGEEKQIDKLYQALMKGHKKPYDRMASHYNEHFTFPTRPVWYDIPGWIQYKDDYINYLYSHKGLDIDGLPPHNMHTILFARLEPHQLYIKPEAHGTAAMADTIQHTVDYITSLSKKNLPESTLDFLRNFITISPDDAEEFRKERVPAKVFEQAVAFIEEAATFVTEDEKEIAQHKLMMKTWGLQQIIPRLAQYEANEELKKKNPKLHAEIDSYLHKLMKEYQDWQYRKGNEILFKIEELLKASDLLK